MACMPMSRLSESDREPGGDAGAVSDRPGYWARNARLILSLLVLWAVLTFVPSYFAARLTFSFLGWPFSYWMAAYGAPLAYLLIIVAYARIMNRVDAQD
jgi:putative solute:sodium symporter small subunit